MTVTVYSGPGTSAYQSSQYTVTVNGSSAYVYGYGRTAPSWNTQGWSVGDTPYQSWVTWAADETVTVVVTRLAGAITSCTVYPTEDGITKSIVGSTVTLTVPANRRLQVELNGNKRDWLWLFSSPPITIPGGTTNWSTYGPRTVSSVSAAGNTLTVASGHGLVANERVRFYTTGTYPTAVGGDLTEADFYYVTNPLATTIQLSRTSGGSAIDITSAGSGTMQVYRTVAPSAPLYFPAGDWRIGRLFDLQNGYAVYLDGSAHVKGTFDLRSCTAGSHVIGHGVIKADLSTWEVVVGLPSFEEQLQWSAAYGNDFATYNRNNRIEGVTIVCPPFYTLGGYEFSDARNVQIMSGWTPNADGFDMIFRSNADATSSITDCLGWCGDDTIKLLDFYLTATVDNVYCVQSASSAILVQYFGDPLVPLTSRTCRNIYVRQLQLATDDDDAPTNSLVKGWVDSTDSAKGAFYFNLDGLTAVGDLFQRVFSFEVRPYPWSEAGTEKGQLAFFDIRNVVASVADAPKSRILGTSWADTPHDIAFAGVAFDDVTLTAANFFDYFETNAYPYNLTVEGHPVVTAVDISNTALDLIGHSKRITSIAPPDGSAEADACAEHYTDCVNELLDTHDWNFATVKRALVAVDESDDPAWDYCYELPAGLLRVISIIPSDAPDNHYTNTVAVPVDYEIHADSDDTVRIYTDLEEAWIRYVKYVTNPALFSPTFLEALQWKLASRIAGPIIKGTEGAAERDRCMQQHLFAMGKATSRDANQQRRQNQQTISSWHKGR